MITEKVFYSPGVGFSPVCLCPGCRGCESEKCSTVSEKKSNSLFVLKKPTVTSKANVLVLFSCYILQKQYCHFNDK